MNHIGVTMEKVLPLSSEWEKYMELWAEGSKFRANSNKLWAEGDKLLTEGSKLCAEGNKLWAEGSKLCAEGDKLRAEGSKLCAEGNKLRAEGSKLCAEGKINWMTAVIAAYGNCTVKWSATGCTLENGDLYEYKREDKQ